MLHLGVNLISAVIMLSLGIIFYSRDTRSLARSVFLVSCVSTAAWLITNGLLISVLLHDATLYRMIANLMYFSGLMITTSFLLFSWVFPKPETPIRFWRWGWLIAPLIITLVLLFLTDSLIRAVHPDKPVIDRLEYAFAGNLFYTLVFITNMLWSIYGFIRKRRQYDGILKLQLTCLAAGYSFSFLLGGVVMVLLPLLGITQFILLSIILPIPWIVIASYVVAEKVSFVE